MTREESLDIILKAVGGNTPAVNEASQTAQDNASQQSTGTRSRDESLRILQSAVSGGSTAGTTYQSAGPTVNAPQTSTLTATPQSPTATAPLTQGSLAGTGRSVEQVQLEKPLTAADYDKLIKQKEDELAAWDEMDYDATSTTERQAYDKGLQDIENAIESLKAGKWRLEREEKYGALKNNADYETLSTQVADKPTTGFGIGIGKWYLGKGDPTYDFINDIDGARMKAFNATSMSFGPDSIYMNMEEDEIKTYNYLYNTEGKKAANEYLDYLEYALNERITQTGIANAKLMADKAPALSSVVSIGGSLTGGIGLADATLQKLERDITGEYKPIDYNRRTMSPSIMSSTIRGKVAQNIADSTGVINLSENEHPVLSKVFNGKSLGDVYQLGMSIADSTAVALSPFGKYGAVLLGGNAGTQGMLDALERGATDEQAIKMGLLNATFEALFEYASLDKLLTGNPKNLVLALLQQGGVEASEEAATTLANNVADILVMAEKSDYQLKIQAYMESGMSREEATKQALLDKCIELGWDAAGGFFSGGVTGGGKYVLGKIKALKGDSQQRSGMEKGAENAQTKTEPTTQPAAETQAKPYQTVEELSQPNAGGKPTVEELTRPITQAEETTAGGNPSVSLRSTAPLTQGSQSAQTDLPTATVTQEAQEQAAETAQEAQRVNTQAETPPTTRNAALAASGELNRQAETMAREQDAGVQREARTTEGADTVRGFSKNVATDSAMEAELREEKKNNPDLYKRLGNKETLEKAESIFVQGLDYARSELERAIGAAQSGQKFPIEMVPLSRMVANALTRRGELAAASKIISDVGAELTYGGELGQAGAILRNADPITVLNTLQKSLDRINKEAVRSKKNNKSAAKKLFGLDKISAKNWTAELTPEEIQQIANTDFSQDGAFESVQRQIAERLGREMPATLLEKLREIRKVGMLANPKTQVKNVAGNVPLAGERKIAEKLSGGLQELAVKAGIMSKEEQTRTLRVSQESKDIAKSVYENNIDRINRKGNKGELRGILKDTRTYFNKGLLQKGIEKATGHQLNDAALDYVRRFTYDCLEKGDAPFVKSAFIDSLAQYCEAQGIKSEADVTETAISYATDQAMAATFKDASALANLLNGIKDKAGIAGQALDVLLPFTTTPINIAKEFGKYSPLGYFQLINTKGKGRAEVIDIISRATTGSVVVALGALLRSLGFITGAADDDKDKAAADKAAGISPYSILGKYSYEWAQPTGSALAMGASIYDAAKDGGSLIETISNGIISAGDAYLEQSFYKDIIDLFQGYGSPTENMLKEVLTGTASQFIPTIVGATARTIDPTVRTSYTGGNIIDDILAQAKMKTPGLSKSAPASVNVRGEETQRGNLVQRILDNFIFPWTTNRNGGEENAVDEAINEVYADTADKTIFRQVSPYKVDYGGEAYKMTGEEREQFQKTQGQVHDDILQQIIDGTLWQEMDNDAKVKTMQLANEYALDAAKRELVESRGDKYTSDWDDEAELADVGNYLAAKTTLEAVQDSKDYTLLDALVDTVSEQQKAVQEKLNKDFSMLDELIYGKQRGVDAETIYTAKTEADANGNGKISQEELWYYLGLQKNMPTGTKDVLWDILTTGKTGYSEYAKKQK